MSDQMSLVGPATPPGLRLTRRQRFALEFVALKPRSSEELGAALHGFRLLDGGKGHPIQQTCEFCKAEGSAMGSRLREDGLVRFARNLGVWYLAEQGRPKPDRGAQTDEIPY